LRLRIRRASRSATSAIFYSQPAVHVEFAQLEVGIERQRRHSAAVVQADGDVGLARAAGHPAAARQDRCQAPLLQQRIEQSLEQYGLLWTPEPLQEAATVSNEKLNLEAQFPSGAAGTRESACASVTEDGDRL
jgi:hypothetical protein